MTWRAWLLLALLGLAGCGRPADDAGLRVFERAEVVAAGWDSREPPATGWTEVTLIDDWSTRWPDHDGVGWYRIRWHQDDASRPLGLLLDYLCMGGEIRLNGSLLARDPQLVEPLSRSWTKPRYFLVDAPLLRQGENTLLVRVSGLAEYQPGFGAVTVGDPALVEPRYRAGLFARHEVRLVNMAIAAVLGAVFALVWLLRRQDAVYGWFSLSQVAGSLWSYNYIAPSPWPFASTDGWQAFIVAMYMLACASYVMFLLRFGERRFPWLERAMGVACAATLAVALATPGWLGPHREPWTIVAVAFYYVGIGWFLRHALRTPRTDTRVLAACLLLPVGASMHDFALYLGWLRGDTYWLALTSVPTLLGIAFALAWRFVGALRRVEGFNAELRREVDTATRQLGETLAREHALALANTRAGERLQLTRDLHDGFGGTLLGALARLEQAEGALPRAEAVALLRDMRDDLRLVIDSTTGDRLALPELLAPLRHRSAQLLEAAGIDARWRLTGVDDLELDSARGLDLLRLLQEALTNAFKHSGARRVDVILVREGDALQVEVRDDGRGFTADAHAGPPHGAGLASMRLRARRLGGQLELASSPSGTLLRCRLPLAP